MASNPDRDHRPQRVSVLREQTAFKLPPNLLAEFRVEAARAGVTMTSVVEQGIRNWLRYRRDKEQIDRMMRVASEWNSL